MFLKKMNVIVKKQRMMKSVSEIVNEGKSTQFMAGDTVQAEVTKGKDATITRVEKDVPGIGTMIHIEWKDKKKGLMQWSGKPESFSKV